VATGPFKIHVEPTTEELDNTFYNLNQQDTEILEDPDDVGKTTSETEQAMMA
jgi:hypothetical protein